MPVHIEEPLAPPVAVRTQESAPPVAVRTPPTRGNCLQFLSLIFRRLLPFKLAAIFYHMTCYTVQW